MNFLFAWRYFRSKKSTNAINIIAWISVTAIMVGTASLIIVLSVFNGFEDLVQGLYKDFYADIRVAPASGKTMRLTHARAAGISSLRGIAALSFEAEEKALLVNGDYQVVVFIKGVDTGFTVTNRVNRHMIRGTYDLGTTSAPRLVIGAGVENAAGIDVDRSPYPVTLYLPNGKNISPGSIENSLNSYNAIPAGTFVVQQEFDNKYVFSNLSFLQFMLNMQPDEYSAAEIKLSPGYDAGDAKRSLAAYLGSGYLVQTRFEQNQGLFTVMQVEKWVIYLILSLILVVAAFNMIGALTMLVLEKQKDIAVLKAMGLTAEGVQRIFITEGFVLAGVGAALGALLAFLVCFLQLKFKLVPLSGGSFIIDYYPVKMQPGDFMLVAATVFVIALLAAWIPARKAAGQSFSLKS